jgi:Ca-activated chloride channel family protein
VDFFLRFEHIWLLGITLPLVCAAVLWRYWYGKEIYYSYSLGQQFKTHNKATRHPYRKIFYLIHFITILTLAFLIAKPQLVDSRSNIQIEGIDIMLVLDASGSMQFQDYSDDERSRFQVAKDEAIRFIKKRVNDAMGLVIFGKDAISRSPLTMDKHILEQMVGNLKIGDIDPDGTMLATAMVTGINRLKASKAQSKIMILLTDGEPSEGDMDPAAACAIAKKLGIKIYTIGIGSEEDQVFMHPLYGMVAKPKVNVSLLKQVARETGGRFFMAHNAKDMRTIYDTIDELEKTKHEAPLYSQFFDVYSPFVCALLGLLTLELIVSSFVWFSI